MVTQKQIAHELGVTQQAVSYALTGSGSLSPEMRERIVTTATEFGYRPNASARAMKSGRFGSVALLLGTGAASSNMPEQLWNGVHDELALSNLSLVMAKLPDDTLSDTAVLPKILRELSVDGVLIDYTHRVPARLRDALQASQLPAVWFNSKRDADCVYPDDFGAGEAIGKHLIEAGHRRIAYVNVTHDLSDAELHYSVRDRPAGLQSAAQKAGAEVETAFLAALPMLEQLAALRALWERPQPITAVVGYDPQVFELLCRAAWKSGKEVPDDVSCAIFCAPRQRPCCGFQMTRMEVAHRQEGEVAVRQLLQKITGTVGAASPQAIPFVFQKGETVVAPKLRTSTPPTSSVSS